jgi:hypothetical protein
VPIISAAARNNLPAVYPRPDFARDDGLLSYGREFGTDTTWRGPASYVDRILRGAKPGDLPVQFPTKFEMVVNLKTAKVENLNAIGVRLADRADEMTQVTLRGLADDLRLAARIAEALATMRTEVAEVAAKTMDSSTRDQLRDLMARMWVGASATAGNMNSATAPTGESALPAPSAAVALYSS